MAGITMGSVWWTIELSDESQGYDAPGTFRMPWRVKAHGCRGGVWALSAFGEDGIWDDDPNATTHATDGHIGASLFLHEEDAWKEFLASYEAPVGVLRAALEDASGKAKVLEGIAGRQGCADAVRRLLEEHVAEAGRLLGLCAEALEK